MVDRSGAEWFTAVRRGRRRRGVVMVVSRRWTEGVAGDGLKVSPEPGVRVVLKMVAVGLGARRGRRLEAPWLGLCHISLPELDGGRSWMR
ncbi:hypothetical protein U1Q18_016914 [Sarracenia purpurea var. burkii]